MQYKAEFDMFSDTNKFLDELFREDCAFDWQCNTPEENKTCNNPNNIVDANREGMAEEAYLKSLISDISEKLSNILAMVGKLPDSQTKGTFFTKGDLISRIIGVSNTLDGITNDFASVEAANGLNTAIISGDITFPAMF